MDEIKREQLFLQRLQETVKAAKANRNTITEEALRESFADLSLSEAQMEQVRAYLAANKIGIDETLPFEEYLTEEEHNYLEDYLAALSAIEQPSAAVLEALRLSAMAGERDAQQRLIEVMLPEVVDIAKLYVGQEVALEDLIGAGNEALTRGVTMLAPLEGPQEVEGTLGRMVMDAMEDLIAENLDEKAKAREVEERVNAVAGHARELAKDLGRKVTAAELAAEGDVDLEQIREAMRLSGNKIEELEQ